MDVQGLRGQSLLCWAQRSTSVVALRAVREERRMGARHLLQHLNLRFRREVREIEIPVDLVGTERRGLLDLGGQAGEERADGIGGVSSRTFITRSTSGPAPPASRYQPTAARATPRSRTPQTSPASRRAARSTAARATSSISSGSVPRYGFGPIVATGTGVPLARMGDGGRRPAGLYDGNVLLEPVTPGTPSVYPSR
ncbi:hypothetical protein [Streptomyces sp. NBC_01669]|uniref:hypothetical protein n=1 Tax=Streptomyces sp. NBC_01669 TaxID=2975909 RepID=UPI002258D43F|nr:hypothetical protein [Streptomyces sp. NBC_01669]MCX4537344.1 hypothetical protein [Streptomyces sp. NBC_01669]